MTTIGPGRFQINASNLADKRHVTTCLSRGDGFFGIGRTVSAARRTDARA